jgi:ligand-binding sensor domain-containing protein
VIYEDSRGRLWLGAEQGLFAGRHDAGPGDWRRVRSPDGLPRSWVRAALEARDGTLYFGTNGDGVLRYEEGDRFDVLSADEGLPSNLVRDLYEDRDGLIWIALEDRGLCRLDRLGRQTLAEGDLRCLDSRNGLYQSGLHRILEDDYGRFWFNTNNGIFWVEHAMLNAFLDGEIPAVTSVSYTEAEGMRNREGNGGVQPAGVKASDGRLWFPTQDGVVVIDPREVPLPEAPAARRFAPCSITSLAPTEAGARSR